MENVSASAPIERRIVGCMGKFCGYLPDASEKDAKKYVF